MRQKTLLATVALIAALEAVTGRAEAISQTGITAPFQKEYSLVESKSKGAPCTCVVPASITKTVDKLVPGFNRTKIELTETSTGTVGFFTIPTCDHGSTCYLYVPEVETDAICDVFAFVPYEGTRVHLYSCWTETP